MVTVLKLADFHKQELTPWITYEIYVLWITLKTEY